MLRRGYRTQESLVRYWAGRAVELCRDFDDPALQEYVAPVREAVRAMERDRRLMVIGGEGCGKSSLLAGLAECPFMARVPLTDHYVCWRFRCSDGDATCSRFVPVQALEGLELVDTQPCDRPEVAATVRGLLPGADVVIAVIDGRHPDDSPVWELLSSMPEGAVGSVVLAVTFTESVAGGELENFKSRLRDACRTRLGRNHLILCISPLSAQAMDVFRARVQDALDETHVGLHAAALRVKEAGLNLLRSQGSVLMKRESVARTNSGFLTGIEREIDNFLSHQRAGLPRQVELCASATQVALPRLFSRLRWTLGWVFSPVLLLRLELLGAGAETFLYRTLRDEILRRQKDSDVNFVYSCGGHWKSVRPRMKRTLECEIGDFPEEELALEVGKLRERLGRELYDPFSREQLRHHFSRTFKARIGWMRACLAAICLFLFFAGACGALGQDPPAIALAVVAILVWLVASVCHLVAKRRVMRSVKEQTSSLDAAVRAMLADAEERLVISRVASYRRLYTKPRRKVAEHEATLVPLRKRQQNIQFNLSSSVR